MATLRELLALPEPVLAPGAYGGLSARLVERAGFPAVYLTGFGASASLLGRPDVGLLSFDEMAGQARRLVQAVSVPVIDASEMVEKVRAAVEAPEGEDEVAAVADAFPDTPLVFNWVDGGKTPALGLDRIRELGFALVIYLLSTLPVASRAVGDALARLRQDGTPAALDVPAFDEFTGMIGLPELRALESREHEREALAGELGLVRAQVAQSS